MGQDGAERLEVIARPGRGDVQKGDRAGFPRQGEPLGQAGGVELGKDQEIADVQDAWRRAEGLVQVGRGEIKVGAGGVDEPAVLAPDVEDQGLAGRPPRADFQGLDVHSVGDEGLGGEPAQDVVADPGTDRDGRSQPRQVDGGVGRPAADVEDELIDRHKLTRAGQPGDGRGDVVDDDHPRAHDGRGYWRLSLVIRQS